MASYMNRNLSFQQPGLSCGIFYDGKDCMKLFKMFYSSSSLVAKKDWQIYKDFEPYIEAATKETQECPINFCYVEMVL